MRNKKLIPFETIEKAVAGEPEAIDAVLRHYTTRIQYLPTYRGHINNDIQDRLKAQLIKAIGQPSERNRIDRLCSQASMKCYAVGCNSRLI
ncbi:MAG: helix-turn-helix domain-containing protein [Lachnoclostridium edouardi]|uniref:helix-turn-helix domain-containing protein n=1 Tax=Lachnoclostridium edouardi TaxID=1926283 RepID=UPI0026DB92FB|nr:helix-turn-helix domain-containing protein [Lachnoclostridium edouardi]MDO4277347.1 helix-turn-helix domain-containing protein [Lachnoclostridium edouardi]